MENSFFGTWVICAVSKYAKVRADFRGEEVERLQCCIPGRSRELYL